MKKEIILKSMHPEEYADLVIECRVIPNEEIGAYIDSIADSKKIYAYKSAPVKARKGVVGETISTVLKTVIEGKEYILHEESAQVKELKYTKEGKEYTSPSIVVTNCHSTSNEEYVVKPQKFIDTYTPIPDSNEFAPVYDSRLLTQVDENIIIMTAWGAPAVCLAGSYIVTYDAESNDYNTIEKGAFESTYTIEESLINTNKTARTKKITRK